MLKAGVTQATVHQRLRDGHGLTALVAGAETDPAAPSVGNGGAAAHLHGPSQLFANVIPLPTTNDAPTPPTAATSGDHHKHGDDERGEPEVA